MKNLITIIFALAPLFVTAQEFEVESFDCAANDLTARFHSRTDLIGRPCALIKVYVPDKITEVRGNFIGDIEDHGMEKWIYMTEGTKEVELLFDKHYPLHYYFSDSDFPSLTQQMTYVMKLVEKEKTPSRTAQASTTSGVSNSQSQRTSNNIYMPMKNGMVLTYTMIDANGNAKTLTNEVYDVQKAADGAISAAVRGTSDANVYEQNYYRYTPNNRLTRVVLMSADDYRRTLLKAIETSITDNKMRNKFEKSMHVSGELVIPLSYSVLPGETFSPSTLKVDLMGQDNSLKISNGKYLGYEDLATEAGKFPCLKVSYEIIVPNLSNNKTFATSWYAPEIGLVKTIVKDTDGKTLSEQVLRSISM